MRGKADARAYQNIAGFRKDASLEDVRGHDHVLTPGRYVGVDDSDVDDSDVDGEPFEEKMRRLTAQLIEQIKQSLALDAAISANLKELGQVG